jgi:spermidine/putrescine transport system ATP-binding protein
METTPAVELAHVWKRFETFEAVKDISLSIAQGEFFSMLGASGCGKTTTLRMIAGFEHPSEGDLRLAGSPVGGIPAHKRNVNMVFQNYALFPHMSVFENVAFGLEVKRTPRDEIRRRVGETLDSVHLIGMDRRRPSQLSGGQQQRVALARALVNRPTVLLLDEPLGALDQKLRKEMQLELKRLQREVGITFIYVTHDQEEALTMSDRIAVMNQGRVLQVADPRTLYNRPATRFVADFIGTTNFLEGVCKSVSQNVARISLDQVGEISAHTSGEVAAGQAVTVAIRPEHLSLNASPDGDKLNRLSGSIDDVIFVGNDTQCFVRLKNDQRIMVRFQNKAAIEVEWKAGQQVSVSWEIGSATLLKD